MALRSTPTQSPVSSISALPTSSQQSRTLIRTLIINLAMPSDEPSNRQSVNTGLRLNPTTPALTLSFKFIGVHIANKLSWSNHTKTVVKRAQQHLFPLRRLKRFGQKFYSCTIQSILTGCITAWYGNCSESDRKALQRVEHVTQGINGAKLSAIDTATRQYTSTPSPFPPGGVLVRRDQVCLSTFYKDCAETTVSDPNCSCQPEERDGRPPGPRDTVSRKAVDENYNNVSPQSRGSLAGKLQQLLTPTRHRVSGRRAASVDARRSGGENGPVRRVSEQRPSRKAQVAESLLKAKERLYTATSESSLSVGSDVDLPETTNLAFPLRKSWDTNQEGAGLEVLMSSCSLCRSCNSLVYDEEIMAGWTSDDSNLNSSCPFCSTTFVPLLNAEICDLGPVSSLERTNWNMDEEVDSAAKSPGDLEAILGHNGVSEDSSSETSSYSESSSATMGSSVGGSPQVTVAYLSPLVLRKELESLLENEGEAVLSQGQLLDSHSIIFWNMVWYFHRLGLPSNLLQLVRSSPLANQLAQTSENSAVRVRLLWDTLTPDTDYWPPLYILWRIHSGVPMRNHSWRRHNHPFTLAFLEEVLRWVGMNEVHKGITLFLETIAKQPGTPKIQRSLYREMLFLTLAAMGRDHVAAFDKKYKAAYQRLSGSLGREELRRKRAQPPSPKAVDCRRSFLLPLEC
ncbi:unnamed protein product [Oncorhynchus mykiss]|uniref:Uncharacterized protein n=1 Tax=Oncorhynchus mykiss TaxID=8022 RepID=A0A060WSC8_ONCMY|nr:unnamed protein product [Oncorhynchus mykiss]